MDYIETKALWVRDSEIRASTPVQEAGESLSEQLQNTCAAAFSSSDAA